MGVPTSEVGYTSATTGKGDHEVHKGHVVTLEKKTYRQLLKHHWSQMLNANMNENIKEQPNKTNFYLTLNPAFIYSFSI
jgi:hypothetical protein